MEHLQRHLPSSSAKSGEKTGHNMASSSKDIPKKAVGQSNHPWQRPAAGATPAANPGGQPKALGSKPGPITAAPGTSKPPTIEPSCPPVKYSQVGVMEMANEYNLVQCRSIHAEKSYDCTLDSGSCLNLIHWKYLFWLGTAVRCSGLPAVQ